MIGQNHKKRSLGRDAHAHDSRTEDNQLALFHDLRIRERRSFLIRTSSADDSESSLTFKLGELNTGLHGDVAFATPPWRGSSNELLSKGAEKNDYDWLMSPPATPLFPSLETESPMAHMLKSALHQGHANRKALKQTSRTHSRQRSTRSVAPRTPSSTGNRKHKIQQETAVSLALGSHDTTRTAIPSTGHRNSTTLQPPSWRIARSASLERYIPSSIREGRGTSLSPVRWGHDNSHADQTPPNLCTSMPERKPRSSSRGAMLATRQQGANITMHSYSSASNFDKSLWHSSSTCGSEMSSSTTRRESFSDRFTTTGFATCTSENGTVTKGTKQSKVASSLRILSTSQNSQINPRLKKDLGNAANGESSSKDGGRASDAKPEESKDVLLSIQTNCQLCELAISLEEELSDRGTPKSGSRNENNEDDTLSCTDIEEDVSKHDCNKAWTQNSGSAADPHERYPSDQRSLAPAEGSSVELSSRACQQEEWSVHQNIAETTMSLEAGGRTLVVASRASDRLTCMTLDEHHVKLEQDKRVASLSNINAEAANSHREADHGSAILSSEVPQDSKYLQRFSISKPNLENVDPSFAQMQKQDQTTQDSFCVVMRSSGDSRHQEPSHINTESDDLEGNHLVQSSQHFDQDFIVNKQLPTPIHRMERTNVHVAQAEETIPVNHMQIIKCHCAIM